MNAVETIVVATAEPVSLPEAKTHLRVTSTADDSRIRGFLASSRVWVENETRRRLCSQTLAQYRDGFPCWDPRRPLPLNPSGWSDSYGIELPFGPVKSVSSVQYFDASNQQQTLDASLYEVDLKSTPARLQPVFGRNWPITYARLNAVTVTFVVGYGDIPEVARTAILLKLQELYDGIDRSETIQSILTSMSPVIT
jgi:uncharacterized phiE125 gp8 family phage protein